MTDLERVMAFVLRWEGGYVNDPDDPGGATNMGVTQGTYNAYRKDHGLPWNPVKQITKQEVLAIYEERYWKPSRAAWLKWPLNLAVMDVAVNSGVGRSNQFLNEAFGLPKSTMWNPKLSDLVHDADPAAIARKVCDRREQFFRSIASSKPTMAKFLKGWLNRLNSLRKTAGL